MAAWCACSPSRWPRKPNRAVSRSPARRSKPSTPNTVHLTGWAGAQHSGKGVNDVATDTQWVTSLLDEAAAIVEAEWIRLQQDVALWERELADLPADLPAPRPGPPRVGDTTRVRARR